MQNAVLQRVHCIQRWIYTRSCEKMTMSMRTQARQWRTNRRKRNEKNTQSSRISSQISKNASRMYVHTPAKGWEQKERDLVQLRLLWNTRVFLHSLTCLIATQASNTDHSLVLRGFQLPIRCFLDRVVSFFSHSCLRLKNDERVGRRWGARVSAAQISADIWCAGLRHTQQEW